MSDVQNEIERAIARYGPMTDTRGAAELTGMAVGTLASRRSDPTRGPAPPYYRVGRRSIRYSTAETVLWVQARRVEE